MRAFLVLLLMTGVSLAQVPPKQAHPRAFPEKSESGIPMLARI